MSVQFVDKVRFELNEIDSLFNSIGLNSKTTSNQPTNNTTTSTTNSIPSNMSNKLNDKRVKCLPNSTTPKIPSSLVRTPVPSNSNLMLYDRKQLSEFLTERQDNLLRTRSEYDIQFENFFSLTKKFHLEKLHNLKLTFKNQILKQQIYFETEMLDLYREYNRDYECSPSKTKLHSSKSSSYNTTTTKRVLSKYEQEKNLVRQFKMDMKKLLEYMRDSLINSSDTLIEAYETCQTLKSLEQIENNFQKQNNQMKSTTNALIKSIEQNSEKTTNMNSSDDEEDNNSDEDNRNDLEKQLNDEQIRFDKYKQEMDELMHILDDIELQHLQRKDQIANKSKFCNKLKTKFKFIETKYETLNKQITNLKYESNVYKELWNEKKRTDLVNSLNNSCHILFNSNQKTNETENSYSEYNLCSKSSAVSSLSPSSSLSKSSSTSSLSDCVGDIISSSNETNSSNNESSSSSKSTTSSSSSSLCNQDLSDLLTGSTQLDYENESNDSDEHNKDDNRNYLSLNDYNRKLSLINELINLHKSKMSSKDLWSMSSSNCSSSEETNFIKANIKCFDLKDDLDDKLDNYTILNENNKQQQSEFDELNTSCSIRLKQASSLDLTDCSTDGDRVIVENCNLKSDRDISNWFITRQIENMSISKYKLPNGSVIKSGKVLKIETPFANDQLDYLIAIKNQLKLEQQQNSLSNPKCQVKKLCLKIRTRLISPDGTLKAIHVQEIPQFYQDIFKYANMIQFL